MQLHNFIDLAYETFRKHAANAKIILLHPRSRYRSVLIARLINAQESPVFYYALGPDDTNVQSFLSGITHDIANQHPTFGRHLNLLPGDVFADTNANLDLLLETFANDLSELSDQPFFLVLDEYDRCDTADDVQRFVEQLVNRLPENGRVVINSRTLPRLPWVSMIARGSAVLLEDSHLIANDFYDVVREGANNLEVYALGPGFVLLNGEPIDTWEGHLPRLLFFFALDRPVITRSEICEAFWPELDIDQAVNVFHVTKRRLHKALDMDVLVHDEGYYRINPELGVQYDIIDFVQYVMAGRNQENSNQLESWQHAIDYYRGPFLQGHHDRWILDRRRDFQAGYLEALTETAKVRLAEGRAEYALGLFQRALAEDNSHEELHREIMRLYTQLGRRSEAAAHYQRYVDDRKREAKEPNPETASLYQDIMS